MDTAIPAPDRVEVTGGAPARQNVLDASLIVSSLGRADFEASTGWAFGLADVHWESGRGYLDREASAALSDLVAAALSSASGLSELIGRAGAARDALLSAAGSDRTGAEFFGELLRAARAAGPFFVIAPVVLDHLGSLVCTEFGIEQAALAEVAGEPATEAAAFIADLYRVAQAIAADPEAKQIVLDRSAKGASRAMEAGFPDLWALVAGHAERYGWVRTVAGLSPTTPKEVLQRVQPPLLRWDQAMIFRASAAGAPADALAPTARAEELLAAYRTVAGDLAFGPALLAKAWWLARRAFDAGAEQLGISPDLLRQATADELLGALRGELALDGEELAVRAGSAAVSRSAGEISVRTDSAAAPSSPLTGQSVSLGRAVGRVRIVLEVEDDRKIEPGDILVSNLSTPNYEGQTSVFPYRGIASVSVDKAAAIVTDEGGLLSHAAIISRENNLPTVLGTELATEELRDGTIVEVDATRADGRVFVIEEPRLRIPPGA